MFQCLGLGTVEDGGCGEDWWHPECVLGLSREEYKKSVEKPKDAFANEIKKEVSVTRHEEVASRDPEARRPSIVTAISGNSGAATPTGITKEVSVTRQEEEVGRDPEARRPSMVTAIAAGLAKNSGADGNDIAGDAEDDDDEDTPLPPGFPHEDEFEYFICHKCVSAFPWIKRYAGAPGFLPPVYLDAALNQAQAQAQAGANTNGDSKKRKAEDDAEPASTTSMAPPKRQKSEDPATTLGSIPEDSSATTTTLPIAPKKPTEESTSNTCKLTTLPPLPAVAMTTPISLFLKDSFHTHLCHCASCFPLLKPHPQLLEEEDVYEPPISEDGDNAPGSVGTGSLLDRGEAAFSNMDRARAIQGAMAFAHLKDGLKAFLKPYADEGKAVGAEDINVFFQKLRGDDTAIKEAAAGARKNQGDEDDGGPDGDGRKEQSGY